MFVVWLSEDSTQDWKVQHNIQFIIVLNEGRVLVVHHQVHQSFVNEEWISKSISGLLLSDLTVNDIVA